MGLCRDNGKKMETCHIVYTLRPQVWEEGLEIAVSGAPLVHMQVFVTSLGGCGRTGSSRTWNLW